MVLPKCDAYCLRIVILEILMGKFPSQYPTNAKGGTNLVQWARSAISEGRASELLDPGIVTDTSSLRKIIMLLHIGAARTESDPEKPLDMMEAVCRIEET
ncbi:hypothetical protein MLD38_028975 [Melastoma candidum]|uniref:Uncharacterized protein n=1 Tax=Melastoma candidum TaxID=119954 RepID=A0ACB9N2D0_9MYRT|nr:hypothetical protein MLD38_028975 [Melastoma candidum]